MDRSQRTRLPDILRQQEAELLDGWTKHLMAHGDEDRQLIDPAQLRGDARQLLALLVEAVQGAAAEDVAGPAFARVRTFLSDLSMTRARQGAKPTATARFVLSLKEPVFRGLQRELGREPDAFASEALTATSLLDHLALFTTEVREKGREDLIRRQQEEMLELSTPVVRLWEGILALPLIGTLDSARTQVVMESLLRTIVDTGAGIAIIDITGVPTVDTLVAQHLLKTVAAARLMGAECIISGIRPQIAQTIVHLGVDLGEVVTKATLADAFAVALQRSGLAVTRTPPRA